MENSDERYFEDVLFEKLVASKKFRVFTRDKLDEALRELKLQMKDLFGPTTAKKIGKFVGADLLVLMEGYLEAV
jgi:curli biogenesis system outer membrane secretion channel CsgG